MRDDVKEATITSKEASAPYRVVLTTHGIGV